jgi:dihydroxyacetone kinase-like protein
MKKILNDPAHYVDESLDGFVAAFDGCRRTGRGGRVIARVGGAVQGRVGVVTGGGFGHLPLFAGYVAEGMLDACAVGNVFAGPSADVCGETLRAADGGAGVACVLGNYGGDRMSFAEACDDFEDGGGRTASVIVADDVASASKADAAKRRGVAGMVLAFKTAGASAASGDALDKVADVARRTVAATRSIGVALSPCLIPGADAPGFEVADGRMEIGMGIHGEPGIEEGPMQPADAIVDAMFERLLADGAGTTGRVAVLVNSLGATPLEEILIVYRDLARRLGERRIAIARRVVGHLATSMEMAGFSITLLDVDAELEALLAAPTASPFWR